MKTIIWKELREQGMWAVLMFLGMCLALSFALYDPLAWQDGREPRTITSFVFQPFVAIGAPAVALLLGFLQIVPELMRDQWSFLIHRPATRKQLFVGKVVAGIIMYFLAVVVPVTGAILWTATPGHVAAPFLWKMALVPMIDVLAGFAYYFAAQLIALRRARWYVTRILPIATPGLLSVAVVLVPAFWQAVLAVLVGWFVLGSAAWGAFAADGEYQRQPVAARFSLGLSLAIGIFLTTALVVAAIESAKPAREYTWSQYFVSRNGQVLIARYESNPPITVITDLQGRPVPEFTDQQVASDYYNRSLRFSQLLPSWEFYHSYRMPQSIFRQAHDDVREIWYYIPALQRFEGFDRTTRRSIGWFGSNGFSREFGNIHPFVQMKSNQSYINGPELVTCANAVYQLNWKAREIRLIFNAPPGEKIAGASEIIGDRKELRGEVTPMGTAIALHSRIEVLDVSNKPLFSTPYQLDVRKYDYLRIGVVLPDRFLIWYMDSNRGFMINPESTIVELSRNGEERGHQSLPALTSVTYSTPLDEAALMGGVPLAVWMPAFVFGELLDPREGLQSWPERIEKLWGAMKRNWAQEHAQMLTAMFVFGFCILAALLLCEWIARRYAFSSRDRWAWRALSVILGIFAVPTLLSLRDWPARVSCPACQRRRRVDRERCEHCDQPFPASEIRRGDLFDAESVQGSNLPTAATSLAGADAS